MTLRLFLVLTYWTLEGVFFFWALGTADVQKKQNRLLYAVFFSLLAITAILGAIALHVGAYPLWNNK